MVISTRRSKRCSRILGKSASEFVQATSCLSQHDKADHTYCKIPSPKLSSKIAVIDALKTTETSETETSSSSSSSSEDSDSSLSSSSTSSSSSSNMSTSCAESIQNGKKKRHTTSRTYSNVFKLEVAIYAENHGIHDAVKKYKIRKSLIYLWGGAKESIIRALKKAEVSLSNSSGHQKAKSRQKQTRSVTHRQDNKRAREASPVVSSEDAVLRKCAKTQSKNIYKNRVVGNSSSSSGVDDICDAISVKHCADNNSENNVIFEDEIEIASDPQSDDEDTPSSVIENRKLCDDIIIIGDDDDEDPVLSSSNGGSQEFIRGDGGETDAVKYNDYDVIIIDDECENSQVDDEDTKIVEADVIDLSDDEHNTDSDEENLPLTMFLEYDDRIKDITDSANDKSEVDCCENGEVDSVDDGNEVTNSAEMNTSGVGDSNPVNDCNSETTETANEGTDFDDEDDSRLVICDIEPINDVPNERCEWIDSLSNAVIKQESDDDDDSFADVFRPEVVYPPYFKLKVINYAEAKTLSCASNKYKIPEDVIQLWCQTKELVTNFCEMQPVEQWECALYSLLRFILHRTQQVTVQMMLHLASSVQSSHHSTQVICKEWLIAWCRKFDVVFIDLADPFLLTNDTCLSLKTNRCSERENASVTSTKPEASKPKAASKTRKERSNTSKKKNSKLPETQKLKANTFSEDYKRKVLEFAKMCTSSQAAKKFGVSKTSIRRWFKKLASETNATEKQLSLDNTPSPVTSKHKKVQDLSNDLTKKMSSTVNEKVASPPRTSSRSSPRLPRPSVPPADPLLPSSSSTASIPPPAHSSQHQPTEPTPCTYTTPPIPCPAAVTKKTLISSKKAKDVASTPSPTRSSIQPPVCSPQHQPSTAPTRCIPTSLSPVKYPAVGTKKTFISFKKAKDVPVSSSAPHVPSVSMSPCKLPAVRSPLHQSSTALTHNIQISFSPARCPAVVTKKTLITFKKAKDVPPCLSSLVSLSASPTPSRSSSIVPPAHSPQQQSSTAPSHCIRTSVSPAVGAKKTLLTFNTTKEVPCCSSATASVPSPPLSTRPICSMIRPPPTAPVRCTPPSIAHLLRPAAALACSFNRPCRAVFCPPPSKNCSTSTQPSLRQPSFTVTIPNPNVVRVNTTLTVAQIIEKVDSKLLSWYTKEMEAGASVNKDKLFQEADRLFLTYHPIKMRTNDIWYRNWLQKLQNSHSFKSVMSNRPIIVNGKNGTHRSFDIVTDITDMIALTNELVKSSVPGTRKELR